MVRSCVLFLLTAVSAWAATPSRSGEVGSVLAHPLFKVGYACMEHGAESAKWDPGDAFGTDCFVEKMVPIEGAVGFWPRPYSGSGNRNEDWFGWQQEVLSPGAPSMTA
jgi:hypothetical protein